MNNMIYNNIAKKSVEWFTKLQSDICDTVLKLEHEYQKSQSPEFKTIKWDRGGGGGGTMKKLNGQLFEKLGVNCSTVYGELSEAFSKDIPGITEENKEFFATGISLVAHMASPFIPTIHFNTRLMQTKKLWFGGGMDMTPYEPLDDEDKSLFHNTLKSVCDNYDPNCYNNFKKQCDEYFFIRHRNIARGIGGIFYDNILSDNIDNDFEFTKAVGASFLTIFPKIVKKYMDKTWNTYQKEQQLIKRGYYVEFNLLYDRGTKFGIMTSGNPDAIFMSLPPTVQWP